MKSELCVDAMTLVNNILWIFPIMRCTSRTQLYFVIMFTVGILCMCYGICACCVSIPLYFPYLLIATHPF